MFIINTRLNRFLLILVENQDDRIIMLMFGEGLFKNASGRVCMRLNNAILIAAANFSLSKVFIHLKGIFT